jgi:FMN phosphatase YigB (HAD superfamily)
MNLRAVIFDIYNTLLEVGPPPADAAEQWDRIWRDLGRPQPPLSLSEFDLKCRQASAATQAIARAEGVAFPEDDWPRIATQAAAELSVLSESALAEFLNQHARLQRTTRLMPGAAALLRAGHERRLPTGRDSASPKPRWASRRRPEPANPLFLGLCSNCQPYTLDEFAAALAAEGLSTNLFDPELCSYSFTARIRKPDPAIFASLQSRLASRGILPSEILMVGDRFDNDILPARALGWRTWQLSETPAERPGGTFAELSRSELKPSQS